jgi:hypothetical protein
VREKEGSRDGEIFKKTCGKAEENPLGKKQKTGEVRGFE